MKTSTLGMLAIFVLFAGVLAHPLSDAYAVQTRKSLSSTEKNIEDQKIKDAEKRQGPMMPQTGTTNETKPMKKEISSTDMKSENDKIKDAEKKTKDDAAQAKEKSIGKTLKSTKHRAQTVKKERLAAGIKH